MFVVWEPRLVSIAENLDNFHASLIWAPSASFCLTSGFKVLSGTQLRGHALGPLLQASKDRRANSVVTVPALRPSIVVICLCFRWQHVRLFSSQKPPGRRQRSNSGETKGIIFGLHRQPGGGLTRYTRGPPHTNTNPVTPEFSTTHPGAL
jgi:hypothetical protein